MIVSDLFKNSDGLEKNVSASCGVCFISSRPVYGKELIKMAEFYSV